MSFLKELGNRTACVDLPLYEAIDTWNKNFDASGGFGGDDDCTDADEGEGDEGAMRGRKRWFW